MIVRRLFLAAVAVATLAACSFLTSLDELTEGDGGGGSVEAGTVTEGGSADATVDARTDSATNGDAGVDATFCASLPDAATLCADFDDRALPAPFETIIVNGSGSVVERDDKDSRSAPYSLLLGAGLTNGSSAAAVRKRFPGIRTEVSVDLDVKFETFGTEPFDLVTFGVGGDHELGLEVRVNGAVVFDKEVPDGDGGAIESKIETTATLGTAWAHLRFVAVAPANGTEWQVTASKDGVAVGTVSMREKTFKDSPNLWIGDWNALDGPAPAAWRVRVDNVVVRTK